MACTFVVQFIRTAGKCLVDDRPCLVGHAGLLRGHLVSALNNKLHLTLMRGSCLQILVISPTYKALRTTCGSAMDLRL